ncbi:acetate/propionate family kinase [soil metagenome]
MNSGLVLTINGGSSSVRFAVFEASDPSRRVLHGKIDRVGLSGSTLQFSVSEEEGRHSLSAPAPEKQSATDFLMDWLEAQPTFGSVEAVGHRVVQGMQHSQPERITPELLDDLRKATPYDPDHLPYEIELIEAIGKRYPGLPQVACFDTAFHRTMPRVATLLPIPRKYAAKGLQRYGFHGLSYEFLLEELVRTGGPAARKGRTILAHLGNGASLAAVLDGESIDTTMGFTPTGGTVMGTRTGDLDPGVAYFLAREEGVTADGLQKMFNHESGLLGVSETSSDMRDLLAAEPSDVRAAEAVALFCYEAKKWLGALAAALGGLDTLVFSGGIGENSPVVRERICAGLGFLGIDMDQARNAEAKDVISSEESRVEVRVIRTDEELMIARSVLRLLNLGAAVTV